MKKLLISTLIFLMGCFPERPYHTVCLKLYMLGGHIKEESFKVKEGTSFYICASEGDYSLCKSISGMNDAPFVKSGVVDFEEVKCN